MNIKAGDIPDWLDDELRDTVDEDIEIEFEDDILSAEIRRIQKLRHPDPMDRRLYFRELLHLQGELIRLQDWVSYHKEKVVVLFEGRDSAGKGGAIKRITQRLDPRVARVVALPAPSRRERGADRARLTCGQLVQRRRLPRRAGLSHP